MTKARILADYVAGGVTAAEFDVLDGLTSTTAELNYVDGVTSNVQTQMDAKLALAGGTMTGDLVPTTPLSHRNIIINGAMQVAQRSSGTVASSANTNTGYHTVDRWGVNESSDPAGTITWGQDTESPDGFSNSLKLDCTSTGTPGDGTPDFWSLDYKVEAQDLQHLAYGTSSAKTTTFSWYMKATNFASPISVAFETQDGTAQYFNVQKTPTSSWARYSITIPGSTAATITNDNGIGMFIRIILAADDTGSYVQSGDSTTWSTNGKLYQSTIGNLTASTSNVLFMTGFQWELGSSATPFEHRSYADELRRCMRYYQTCAYIYEGAFGASGSGIPHETLISEPMRPGGDINHTETTTGGDVSGVQSITFQHYTGWPYNSVKVSLTFSGTSYGYMYRSLFFDAEL